MKRLFTIILLCLTITCCFTGCLIKDLLERDFNDEKFFYRIIDDNNVAVGNVRTYPESGAVFFPEKIRNYTVSKLGFSTGMGFGGNGYLTTFKVGEPKIKRCYFPHTIKKIGSGYISSDLKMFYCGAVIDLIGLDVESRNVEIYVPAEKYELFEDVLSKRYFRGSLLKANVSYYLNYAENNYYYIDYYENGEKVVYIPPAPQREEYSFGGWFKESDCINEWDFSVDTVQLTEEVQEVKLYAKWVAAK